MRVIRYALIAILLLSASSAQAQNQRVIKPDMNRAADVQKKLRKFHQAATIHPRPAATSAMPGLEEPTGLAFDPSGNLYIAAAPLQEILKVTPAGVVSVFAGDGTVGSGGDGGPAVDAELDDPFDVAVDASGNVFIADLGNNEIREVTTDGNINTVAGGGTVCGTPSDPIGDGCPATQATLNQPEAVAVDANGNLLIADTGNQVVRRVNKTNADHHCCCRRRGHDLRGSYEQHWRRLPGDAGNARKPGGIGGRQSRKYFHRRCGIRGRAIRQSGGNHQSVRWELFAGIYCEQCG